MCGCVKISECKVLFKSDRRLKKPSRYATSSGLLSKPGLVSPPVSTRMAAQGNSTNVAAPCPTSMKCTCMLCDEAPAHNAIHSDSVPTATKILDLIFSVMVTPSGRTSAIQRSFLLEGSMPLQQSKCNVQSWGVWPSTLT